MKKTTIWMCLLWLVASTGVYGKDEYWSAPQGSYEERCRQFMDYHSEHGVPTFLYGVFRQLSRAGSGRPLEEENMRDVLAVIKSNHDCNDFTLNGLLRMVYMDKEKAFLPDAMRGDIKERILDFKYWWDDGRRDTTYRCYHTENHQALYHTAELLAGQLYKKERFANGMTGKQHIAHAKGLIEPWLDYRFRFGFSEWLSTYYEVEVLLLANLYDYAEDKVIRDKARMVLDLLLFDVALNNYQGFLGGSSGRTYAHSLLDGTHYTSPLTKLVFGVGCYDRTEVIAPAALATSRYRCPDVIAGIATDYAVPILNRQRVSINVEDAEQYGLSYAKEQDCHLFWGMQEFIHPNAVRMSKQISEKFDVWPYRNYDDYIRRYDEQVEKYGKVTDMRLDRFALSEANVETWRTPDYMLSCALDYRKGAPGYQQHVWQATLGNKALVYTNNPGQKNLRWSPNYWAGNEILPRAAMHRNVVVCLYNIPAGSQHDHTHAYFPVEAFDEIHLCGHWAFARKGDGFVALYSRNETTLKADERGVVCDLLAEDGNNVWICETGSRERWGGFSRFVDTLSAAEIVCDGLEVRYASPSEGLVTFGWDSPFTVNGENRPLRWTCRYDNPYCKAPFDTTHIEIERNGHKLVLDLNAVSSGKHKSK